jgi:uncharacterized membrane protein YphA (DoxX/SURF4 family)
MAHEAWFLTREETAAWNARPVPEIFAEITPLGAAMLVATVLAVTGWMLLAARLGADRSSKLVRRLDALEERAPLVVRACLGLTLGMAALGLSPRHGTHLLEAPTLGFPDLELRLLGGGWDWLALVELGLAAALLLGVHVRAAAFLILLLTALGLQLFGAAMLAYAGALAGAAGYLLLRDAGPPPAIVGGKEARPARDGRERALLVVRLLTGATLLYCGIRYKFLQPNLAVAVVAAGGMPTFGLGPEAFVFGMALVETCAGALMMAGVLVRPLALALLGPFLLLSAALGENPLGHALFYGNLFALATGGAGSWSRLPRLGVVPRNT